MLYDWEPLTIGNHATNFAGLRHCGRGDNMMSICHVISKDNMFKGLPDFIGKTPYNSLPYQVQ